MILMIWAAATPSACERSWTVTPEGTVTGPVGWGPARLIRPSLRAVAGLPRVLARPGSRRSMTTRRLRPRGP